MGTEKKGIFPCSTGQTIGVVIRICFDRAQQNLYCANVENNKVKESTNPPGVLISPKRCSVERFQLRKPLDHGVTSVIVIVQEDP